MHKRVVIEVQITKTITPPKHMKNDSKEIFNKASLAHKDGRLAEAENAYLEILKQTPESGPVLYAQTDLRFDDSGQRSWANHLVVQLPYCTLGKATPSFHLLYLLYGLQYQKYFRWNLTNRSPRWLRQEETDLSDISSFCELGF